MTHAPTPELQSYESIPMRRLTAVVVLKEPFVVVVTAMGVVHRPRRAWSVRIIPPVHVLSMGSCRAGGCWFEPQPPRTPQQRCGIRPLRTRWEALTFSTALGHRSMTALSDGGALKIHRQSISRLVVGLSISALSVLGASATAGAAENDCNFSFDVLQNNLKEKTFVRGDETIVRTTGALKIRLTNPDTDQSIVRNISGPVELTYHADGSVTQVAAGPSFTVLEEDVERGGLPAGPVITYGRVESRFERGTPGGELTGFSVVSVSGRHESVCEALAAD